jgi:diguanylate cyclase (GGDEF)-like protein
VRRPEIDREAAMHSTLVHSTSQGPDQPTASGLVRPSPGELAHIQLLAGADLEPLEGLFDACEIRELVPDETLFVAGATNTTLYLILSGRLRVHLESPDGDPAGMLEAGESVGELSMIDQRPTSAYVLADAPTRLLAVPQAVFWALIAASHAVARNLLVCLSGRLRQTDALAVRHNAAHRHYLRQTVVDEVTGLHNRRWFENSLKRQALRSGMNGDSLSVILLDIDRFDRTNRAFGDEAGDAILYAVARSLENALRPTDLLARYGADGYAIALPDATSENALIVATRLQADIAAALITMDDGSILPPVTASCGVATLQDGTGAEGLMANAMSALKDARRAGSNKLRG